MHEGPAYHILADHGDPDKFLPYRIRILLTSGIWRSRLRRLPGLGMLQPLALGLKLWWVGLRHRGPAPFVTAGSRQGFVLAALQWLTGPLAGRRTHVMVDLLLEKRRRGLAGWFDRVKVWVFRRAVDKAVIWGLVDIERYHVEHGIPREKMTFRPYSTTVDEYSFEIRDEGYLFAGGNGQRDYATLIEALKEIGRPVFIATTLPGIDRLAKPYSNITVRGVSAQEFRQRMAGCSVFVECHDPSYLRCAGHQTFLNAMWMGKPVVMADELSAMGYIDSDTEAVIVPMGDAAAVREAVQRVLDDPELAERLGRAARDWAHQPQYEPLKHMQSIYNLALGLELARCGQTAAKDPLQLY